MFKPLGDRILIRQLNAEVERHGIIIPEMAQERPMMATVLAIGDKTEVKVGERIYFSKFGGVKVHVGDYNKGVVEELLVLREGEILLRDVLE